MKSSALTAEKHSKSTRLVTPISLKQVRAGAFKQQLHERLELAEQDKRNAVELAQAQIASEMQKSAVAKDS